MVGAGITAALVSIRRERSRLGSAELCQVLFGASPGFPALEQNAFVFGQSSGALFAPHACRVKRKDYIWRTSCFLKCFIIASEPRLRIGLPLGSLYAPLVYFWQPEL